MKLCHGDLNDSCEAVNALKGLVDDFGVIVHRAEVELTSGERVVFTFDTKAQEHVLSEVEK